MTAVQLFHSSRKDRKNIDYVCHHYYMCKGKILTLCVTITTCVTKPAGIKCAICSLCVFNDDFNSPESYWRGPRSQRQHSADRWRKVSNRLGQTLVRIEEDVIRLKHETQEDRRDINELLEDRDKAHTRLDRLEKEMEQRETACRQRNLKFLGIFKPTPGEDRDDVDELLAMLNYFSLSRTWKHDDIEGTHRISQVHKTSRQHTRPLSHFQSRR